MLFVNILERVDSSIEEKIAGRLHRLRATKGLTLDELASRSGVSRSMISLIERAETSPTANLLDKLAAALGVTLTAFFTEAETASESPLIRQKEQPVWRDPETGYLRRNLSPPGFFSPIELVEATLPPGTRVSYDTGTRSPAVHQQILVLEGRIQVTVGRKVHSLAKGDCLAMELNRPVTFHNPGKKASRHLVALASAGSEKMRARRKP